MTDNDKGNAQHHADAVKKAAAVLNDAIQKAAEEGLTVDLRTSSVEDAGGSYPKAVAKVGRMEWLS